VAVPIFQQTYFNFLMAFEVKKLKLFIENEIKEVRREIS